jgi:YegS/Rv2252/BmrU family lipid kinase
MNKINPAEVQWQIIINPNACSGKLLNRIDTILGLLTEKNIDYEGHISASVTNAVKIIERLCRKGFKHFMFLGGDGTANVVVNGICKSEVNLEEIFLVPLPIGTGNDWVRTHNFPKSTEYEKIVDFVVKGNFEKHDVGLLKADDGYNEIRRHFINIAGFGFDGAVIKRSSEKKPKLFPSAVYIINLLRVMLSYKACKAKIKMDNEEVNDDIYTMAVGICTYNGNGMKQVPMADPRDGFFDVVIIRKLTIWKVIKNVGNIFKGTHIDKLKECSTHRSKTVTITSDSKFYGEVEGEVLPVGNYKLSLLPQQINVLSTE